MKTLIKGSHVLKKENGAYGVDRADVVIDGNLICLVGKADPEEKYDRVIDGKDLLATPALINTHSHAYMSVFRNLADDLPFSDWLFGSIMPREDKMNCEQAYVGSMLSFIEMLRSGTGTYVDMHMFPEAPCKAAIDCGIRGVITRGLAGELGTDGGAERRINEALSEMEKYKNVSTLSFMFGPHAIYTCAENTLRRASELAKEMGVGINIHLSETLYEFETCKKEHGMTPTEYCDSLGLLSEKTVAAHCVRLTERDMEILAERRVNVASCPISNMKLGNGFAPIDKLLKMGVNVCLGTDSCASNNTVNLFPDMRAFALVHKGVGLDALAVSATDTIDAVTVNGARALGLNNGEIKVGALADIALFDLNSPTFRPKNNLASALAYSANGSEVKYLFVDGKEIVSKGELLTVDCEKIYYEAERVIAQL